MIKLFPPKGGINYILKKVSLLKLAIFNNYINIYLLSIKLKVSHKRTIKK